MCEPAESTLALESTSVTPVAESVAVELSSTAEAATGFTKLVKQSMFSFLIGHFKRRWKEEPHFKWVFIGGILYLVIKTAQLEHIVMWPVRKALGFCYNKITIPHRFQVWMGYVESDIPFGRIGYTRCLESETEVLEKFGIPLNAEKCLRDGITYLPGEFYPQFDLNQFDPKCTPMVWSYGPIMDPGLIMPTGWYNDMSGENQEYEFFRRYLRVFGYLPPEAYEELYEYCKIIILRTNEYLIKVGDSDDKVYFIMHGAVDLYSNKIVPHGEFVRLRTATQGCQISSLFGIIEVFTGHVGRIPGIYAVSKLNTTKVLMFPLAALKDYFMRNPQYMVSAILKLLERGYRFQYQIFHVAMRMTSVASVLEQPPLFEERPEVCLPPEEDADLSDDMKDEAIQGFMQFLNVDDIDFFKKNCTVILKDPDEETTDIHVIKSNILNRPKTAYKYVHAGMLDQFYLKPYLTPMEQQTRRKTEENKLIVDRLFRTRAGECVGYLTGLLGYFNVIFYRCVERSIIVSMSRDALEELLERHPLCILPISYMTVFRMSKFIRALDFAIEWTLAKEGQYIYHKDQMCHDSYLILNGRARSYQLDSESHHRAVLEYKENDWIGLVESLLLSKRRSKTCVVIRETEFVKIPNDLLRHIVINFPSAAQTMLNFLVRRGIKSRLSEKDDLDVEAAGTDAESYRESRRTRSIALIPAAEKIPYSLLAVEIKKHFSSWGNCTIMTYEKTLTALKLTEITVQDEFKLEMHILEQLEENDLIIFICLPRVHYWNEISSSHAEIVFTIGCSELPNISTIPAEHEEEVVGKKVSTRRTELILLHSVDVVLPRNTKEWLYCRDWIQFHHHIRLPKSAFSFVGAIPEETIMREYECIHRDTCLNSDLSRFIRWLTGRTFGVLFSSGGARIGAQLGMLQAIIDYKMIPIDMVVGTGAGFLVAALYAVYFDYEKVQEIITKIFKDFPGLAKISWDDRTFPYINLGNGKRLLTYFYEIFGSIQIEDAWIPLCCVTTNLTNQDVRTDRSGPIWVFVRASLSHLGKSPPISDPIDGDYICDGAHANSLPEDIIKEYGAEYIIAFNTVGGRYEDVDNKADPNVNVLRFITKTAAEFIKQLGVANPSFESVFNQLALTQTKMYAAGVEAVSNLKHVVYVRPPVEHLASQSWKNLPTLHRIGYFYMKAIFDKNPYTEDISFNSFWTGIKNTSSDMAAEGGRDLNIVKLLT